ncbi:preprotein translocase subunit SecY [Candidatus Woesearchaeota archaeon]|nr:preprotein translocase subunit SecY [Candidatus Woesearchaeota archaeon]
MAFIDTILDNLPEVAQPKEKKQGFKTKLKWTLVVLVLFYVLGLIPLAGLGNNALSRFEFLSVILGASFGSIISLGIGPIVTASIVLQLLNGSGLVKFDLTTHEGKKRFQGIQKLLSIGFIILEAIIYVQMGGLSPAEGVGSFFLIFQLFLGGLMIMFMDEVVSKYGFGSGISLFIAAGVSQSIFVRALNPLASPTNPEFATGAIPSLFQALSVGATKVAATALAGIVATLVVFGIVVYVQSMKVEIPLSFGRIRGHGVRWPLNFMYTSNIPVILVAALLANVQLFASMVNWGWLGDPNISNSGLISYLSAPGGSGGIVGLFINQGSFNIGWEPYVQGFTYLLFFIAGSILFSVFWVQTAGLDARSQAKQMMASGLQIPGFRKDERTLERMLQRYIGPLTVMGGAAVGILAALADLSGALTSGTGLLLTVMIVYKLYEEIAQQHMMDMNPMMRKFMGK